MQLLGRCIKNLPREEIFVATKVGKYKAGEDEDFSAERVTRSVHESLKRLQLEYIDLILCHDVESAKDMSQVTADCPSLPPFSTHDKVLLTCTVKGRFSRRLNSTLFACTVVAYKSARRAIFCHLIPLCASGL